MMCTDIYKVTVGQPSAAFLCDSNCCKYGALLGFLQELSFLSIQCAADIGRMNVFFV